ncbi:MAG TPA: SPOR domain-containing protein [Steroidobacteraceae bacterium]|nr:SPOR domain-containing protein [Steroidobacteraceae bacterium]
MKERLTGAIILVALIVLLVPELLTGPIRTRSAPAASHPATPAGYPEPPLRSYTLTLAAPPAHDASGPQAGQSPAERAPARPTQSAAASAPETPAESPSEITPTRQGPPPREAAASAQVLPSAPAAQHGQGPGRGLQAARSAAHPSVREAVSSGGGWVVQLGSFASRGNANRLARSLSRKGFRMSVSPARAGSRTLWRVRAGPAHDRAGAMRLAARLRGLGHRGELLPLR